MELSLDPADRLELNAALTKLTESWDENAARMVVNSFHLLPLAGDRLTVTTKTNQNASVKGYTKEAGDITLQDKETQTVVKGESEKDVARIGYFKVKRHRFGNVFVIVWEHFWKADAATRCPHEVPNPEFGVEYSEHPLEPAALLRWDFVEKEEIGFSLRVFLKKAVLAFLCALTGRHYEYSQVSYEAQPTVLFGTSKLGAAR